jgi:TRAP-type uncharacterized transport system substrate-binding protein
MVKPPAAVTGAAKRRLAPALVMAAVLSVAWPATPLTQEISFFRIGTGDTSGTLFAVGSAIASAISNPPGSRPCDRGGSCGVPNLVAVAQSTEGAIENVEAIAAGLMESALVRADVAYWAYYGTGPFATQEPLSNLRAIANLYPAVVHIVAIANLYPAVVHIVARQGQGISTVSDLAGKRVSLGPKASGTPANAQAILAAYGLLVDDIEASYLDSGLAADRLQAGEIDACRSRPSRTWRGEARSCWCRSMPRRATRSPVFPPFWPKRRFLPEPIQGSASRRRWRSEHSS